MEYTLHIEIGDPNHHNCVTNPNGAGISTNWGPEKWPIKELCNPEEDAEAGCCLKRNLQQDSQLGTAHEIGTEYIVTCICYQLSL